MYATDYIEKQRQKENAVRQISVQSLKDSEHWNFHFSAIYLL